MLSSKKLICSCRYFHQVRLKSSLSEEMTSSQSPVENPFSWLGNHAPMFGINGNNVTVLSGPQHFYDVLKYGIETARRRVVLASLYLGTGQMEQTLIDTLLSNCLQSKLCGVPLAVQVLLDYTRGSRGLINSRTLLLPLLRDHGETSQVALYHTPHLRGVLRRLIPERYNEVIGLSHLKVYLFDDDLVMTGANLSNDYFTNRQDRYILFKNVPEVGDFFNHLVSTVSTFSLQLLDDNTIDLHPSFKVHPYKDDLKHFQSESSRRVRLLITPDQSQRDNGNEPPTPKKVQNVGNAISDSLASLSKTLASKQDVISRNFFTSTQHNSRKIEEKVRKLKVSDTISSYMVHDPLLSQHCNTITAIANSVMKPTLYSKENSLHEVQKIIPKLLPSQDGTSEMLHRHLSRYQSASKMRTGSNASSKQSSNFDSKKSPHEMSDGILKAGGLLRDSKFTSHSRRSKHNIDGEKHSADLVDTWLYPLIQMGPLGITVDQEVTAELLKITDDETTCVLASGYFNLVDDYLDLITDSPVKYRILMASPQVNGFYKAKGIAGYVPDAYTFIARKFYNRMKMTGQLARVKLFEYHKDNWTFHAKGLWLCIKGKTYPSFTLIGSPNFGYRSVHRDLEAQLAVVTQNINLQQQLHEEHVRLFDQSQPVTAKTFDEPDRKEPLWVRLLVPIIKNFF